MLQLGYRLARPLLFSLEAERAHRLTVRATAALGNAASWMARPGPEHPVELCGMPIRRRVGLAAGLDKDAEAVTAWEHLGFGFVEVGTVTPRPQAGNPRPRVRRLPDAQAVVNAMGFPSAGAEVVARRLDGLRQRDRWPSVPVGVNLGKNKDTPLDRATDDYAELARRFAPLADFLVINVSSPNTPELRTLQSAEPLRRLVASVCAHAGERPVLVKLAPDLDDEAIRASVEQARAAGAGGFVATNTTVTRPVSCPDWPGGLSGAPLFPLALATVHKVIAAAAGLPVVGVGGVSSPARAKEMIDAGCVAVQVYTGLVYSGPALVRRINEALEDT